MDQLMQKISNDLNDSITLYKTGLFLPFCSHCRRLIELLCQSVVYNSIKDDELRSEILKKEKYIYRGAIVTSDEFPKTTDTNPVQGKNFILYAQHAFQYYVKSKNKELPIKEFHGKTNMLVGLYDKLSRATCHSDVNVKPLSKHEQQELAKDCIDKILEYLDFVIEQGAIPEDASRWFKSWGNDLNGIEDFTDADMVDSETQLFWLEDEMEDCVKKKSNPYYEELQHGKLRTLKNLALNGMQIYRDEWMGEYLVYGATVLAERVVGAMSEYVASGKIERESAASIIKFIEECHLSDGLKKVFKGIIYTMSDDICLIYAESCFENAHLDILQTKEMFDRELGELGVDVKTIFHVYCSLYGKLSLKIRSSMFGLSKAECYEKAYKFLLYAANKDNSPECKHLAIAGLAQIVELAPKSEAGRNAQRALNAFGVETKEEIGGESWLARLFCRLFRLLED